MGLFEFLNAQNGDRLFGYGVLLIIVVAIIADAVVSVSKQF